MICPFCSTDAGDLGVCPGCQRPIARLAESATPDVVADASDDFSDGLAWADDPTPDAIPVTPGPAQAPGEAPDGIVPSPFTPSRGVSALRTAGSDDPTGPVDVSGSASRPTSRPTPEVARRRRLAVVGVAVVAVVLLVVILVVTIGGGSDSTSSPTDTTDVTNATIIEDPIDTSVLTTDAPATTAAPPTTLDPSILVVGSTGADVEKLQKELLDRKFEVSVSGTFDDATLAAVKAFQRMAKLPTVGKGGPATQAALGMGDAANTESDSVEAVAKLVVSYLNSGKRSTLPKDVLNTLLAFRNATKGTKFVWSVKTLKVPAAVANAGEGRQLVQIDAVNRVSKKRRSLTLCFTPTKPVVWCGLWSYQ